MEPVPVGLTLKGLSDKTYVHWFVACDPGHSIWYDFHLLDKWKVRITTGTPPLPQEGEEKDGEEKKEGDDQAKKKEKGKEKGKNKEEPQSKGEEKGMLGKCLYKICFKC